MGTMSNMSGDMGDIQARYDELAGKMTDGSMTESERDEFMNLREHMTADSDS